MAPVGTSEGYAAGMGICGRGVKGFGYLWEAGSRELKTTFFNKFRFPSFYAQKLGFALQLIQGHNQD